ncbi:MAG: hypothetical protein M3Z54_07140 [Gemmatimonadota bacterium]|nr:hypothetical protein [Gemmatimonadota bacterium]
MLSATAADTASAQSASELGAWDGLVLSPIGALTPIARVGDDRDFRQSDLWLRYGRWRYNVDDAIHNNVGVTFFRRPRSGSTEIGFTAAYLSLSCPTCASWLSGGISLQSTFRRVELVDGRWRTLGVRVDIGGARYLGEGHTTAASAAVEAVFNGGVPFVRHSQLSVELTEGFGLARIAYVDGIDGGMRPTLGAALAWTFKAGLAVNVGVERIVLADAPPQVGIGLSWRMR